MVSGGVCPHLAGLRHFLLGWRKLLPSALRLGSVPVAAEVVALGWTRGVAMAALDSDVESLPRGAFRCCLCHITTANRKRWLVRGRVVVDFRLWVLAKVNRSSFLSDGLLESLTSVFTPPVPSIRSLHDESLFYFLFNRHLLDIRFVPGILLGSRVGRWRDNFNALNMFGELWGHREGSN